MVLQAFAERPLLLQELRSEAKGDDEVAVQAYFESSERDSKLVEELVQQLRNGPEVSAVDWAETSLDTE